MKKLLLIIVILFSRTSFGQPAPSEHPAKWTFHIEEKGDGNAELVFKVKLDPQWHIYSQFTPDGGPLPMLFTFTPSDCYTLIGKVTEPKPVEEFDSVFAIKVMYLVKEAELRQKIKLTGKDCTIKGSISYQACKDICISMDTTFTIKVGKGKTGWLIQPTDIPTEGSDAFPSPFINVIDNDMLRVLLNKDEMNIDCRKSDEYSLLRAS